MEYQVIILPSAISDIEKLPKGIKTGLLRKIKWISVNADYIIHHNLQNMPDSLSGLCRIRYGSYRILYWVYVEKRKIKIYRISPRASVYKNL